MSIMLLVIIVVCLWVGTGAGALVMYQHYKSLHSQHATIILAAIDAMENHKYFMNVCNSTKMCLSDFSREVSDLRLVFNDLCGK